MKNFLKGFLPLTLTLFSSCWLNAQELTWIVSQTSLTSVDSKGILKSKIIPCKETSVIVTKTKIQKGKKVTSSKTFDNIDPYFPSCNLASMYVNGLWWSSCNIGSSNSFSSGSWHSWKDKASMSDRLEITYRG